MPGDRPVSEYEVDTLPVVGTIVDHAPPFVDLSISYPVIADMPDGGFHDRLIWDVETAWATRFVGGPSIGSICALANGETDKENSKKNTP